MDLMSFCALPSLRWNLKEGRKKKEGTEVEKTKKDKQPNYTHTHTL